MKCPHCGKEITEVDELVQDTLEAACRKPVEQIDYKATQKLGLAAEGTFVVNGETRRFSMAFDDYRRLTSFCQAEQ